MDLNLQVGPDGSLRVVPAAGQVPFRASGTPSGLQLYAEGGLFGSCKHNPTLINALVNPQGIDKVLTWVGTDVENPIYEAITYIGSTGYAQAGKCDSCGKPVEKRCAQTACFGRLCQQTNEHAVDDIGLRANENVPTMVLFGNITDAAGNVLIPQGKELSDIFLKEIAEVSYLLRLRHSRNLWQGNPINNLGGYQEAPGFDLLINTGKSDALLGIACDALDSTLMDYGSAVVGAAGSPNIVQYAHALARKLHFRINGAGFDAMDAEAYLTMHPNLWDCVADAWACLYGLVCPANVGSPQRQDQTATTARRERYRAQMVLPIDGRDYPVVLDSQIAQTMVPYGNDTAFCSDVYMITTRVGGKLVTFGEFQDFNKTAGAALAWFRKQFGAAQQITITDGGRFIIGGDTYGGLCVDARILVKTRPKMLMPWTSGRIQNVCCSPLGGSYPDPTGSGGTYELDGGVSVSPENYLYGDCWPTHVGSIAR